MSKIVRFFVLENLLWLKYNILIELMDDFFENDEEEKGGRLLSLFQDVERKLFSNEGMLHSRNTKLKEIIDSKYDISSRIPDIDESKSIDDLESYYLKIAECNS